MKHPQVWGLLVFCFMLASRVASSQCTTDDDCEGDLICDKESCVDPSETKTPQPEAATRSAPLDAAPAPAEPVPFIEPEEPWREPREPHHVFAKKGYLTTGGFISSNSFAKPGGFGNRQTGARVAGYGVIVPSFHLGGFFNYTRIPGEDDEITRYVEHLDDLAAGLTMAVGGQIADWFWLGYGLDVGISFYRPATMTDPAAEYTAKPHVYLLMKLQTVFTFVRGRKSFGLEVSLITPALFAIYEYHYSESSPGHSSVTSTIGTQGAVWAGIGGFVGLVLGFN